MSTRRTSRLVVAATLIFLGGCSSASRSTGSVAGASATTASPPTAPASTATAESAPAATTTTAVVKGFAQHFSTALALPDGTTLHAEGDVALSSGVVAAETGIVGTSHLLMFPKVTGTFANRSGASVTLASARIELFLDQSIAHNCVINVPDTSCDDAIIYGGASGAAPATLGAGQSLEVGDDGNVRIIEVPDETANQLSLKVFDGTIVTGYAVVIVGPTADALATTIFNRDGKAVVTCPALPADCMDATRSVLA